MRCCVCDDLGCSHCPNVNLEVNMEGHTGSSDAPTTMSNYGRTEALGLLVEVRDALRLMVQSDYMTPRIEAGIVPQLRKLDEAINLMSTTYAEVDTSVHRAPSVGNSADSVS